MTQADSVHSTPPTNTSPTRRNILGTIAAGGAAALMLTPARAAAPGADPIFAAIERHKAAAAAHLEAIEEQNRVQKIHGFRRGNWITEKPCHDENDAFGALIGAAASTRAGLLAKLQYLQELEQNDEWGWVLDEREGTAIALIKSFAVSVAALMGAQP